MIWSVQGWIILLLMGQLPLSGAFCLEADRMNVAPESGQEQSGPAHPAPVPPNRCRLSGVVLARRDAGRESGLEAILPVTPGACVEALEIRISSAAVVDPNLPSFCRPKTTIEVFTDRQLPGKLGAQGIVVEVELFGSSRERHWWLHSVEFDDQTEAMELKRDHELEETLCSKGGRR